MTPALNWLEIQTISDLINKKLSGLFVEKTIAPHRQRFPEGFLKNEWALLLAGQQKRRALVFNTRTKNPYLALYTENTSLPKPCPSHTKSAFALSLAKYLNGQKLLSVASLPKDRIVIFHFSNGLKLVLALIPAKPEALIVKEAGLRLEIIDSTKTEHGSFFEVPRAGKAPENPEIRTEILSDLGAWQVHIEACLDKEAFSLRQRNVEKLLKERLSRASEREFQSLATLKQAQSEPDWACYGELLKASLPDAPPIQRPTDVRIVSDFASGTSVTIPCNPALSPTEQVEKFFRMAKRKATRIEEAKRRIEDVAQTKTRIESSLSCMADLGDWLTLEALESALGIPCAPQSKAAKSSKHPGRRFVSAEGLTILVGRDKKENLELTFKHARGNDIWMHLRGRPGAHVIIQVAGGKTASLDTLLDAAMLVINFSEKSHAQPGDKIEVDYVFRKHLKRLKNSDKVSYTQNKTLLVAFDEARIRRLIAQNA